MDIKLLPTKHVGDYPEAKSLQGNNADIKLLAKAYSSCGSETTAILQYIFQHYVVEDEIIKKSYNDVEEKGKISTKKINISSF